MANGRLPFASSMPWHATQVLSQNKTLHIWFTAMDSIQSTSASCHPPENVDSTVMEKHTIASVKGELEESNNDSSLTTDRNDNNDADQEFLSDSASDTDFDSDYVDNMLEGRIDVTDSEPPYKKQKMDADDEDDEFRSPQHLERKRMVLIKRDQDHFEILPEGWVEITHFSGMPVYLHKATRVCTLSKPYLLGQGSARKHDVPISSIPCLQYQKELEKEKEQVEKSSLNNDTRESDPNAAIAGIAKVETLKNNKKEKSVDFSSLRQYCQNLFEFKLVTIRKFQTWADRRKHSQIKKLAQRPSLPESTKLITCSVPKNASNSPGKVGKKEFIMNPAGKSVVCILHEFVQHTGRTQPKYKFQELENVAKPYSATVIINDMPYGTGYGSSKKEAKTEAARASLNILIPDLQNATEEEPNNASSELNDLSFFDNIRIEDPRVSELCLKAGQYSPYQILVECLRRHYGVKDLDIDTKVKLLKHQKIEYKMKVGEHEATVICKNKREGKQQAAQSILQKLHSNLNSWGALLKLYGRGSCKTPKEKKEEAQQITELQSLACSNQPNYKILEKLREEMLKLKTCPMSLNIAPINSIQLESTETTKTAFEKLALPLCKVASISELDVN